MKLDKIFETTDDKNMNSSRFELFFADDILVDIVIIRMTHEAAPGGEDGLGFSPETAEDVEPLNVQPPPREHGACRQTGVGVGLLTNRQVTRRSSMLARPGVRRTWGQEFMMSKVPCALF